MKLSSVLAVFGGQGVIANWICPAHIGSSDMDVMIFAYKIQKLLVNYYADTPVNATFFADLPHANMTQSNGKTLAENTATNAIGLHKQSQLSLSAIEDTLVMINAGNTTDSCDYIYPPAASGSAFLKSAMYLEASLCGAFIGLSDYVMSPRTSFLVNRISTEHGIHAATLMSMTTPVMFMPNSTSLTAAFTPDQVMKTSSSMQVGEMGKWLNGCVTKSPMAACGGTVEIGPLMSNVTNQNIHTSCTSSASNSTTGSSTTPTTVTTAAADRLRTVGIAGAAAGLTGMLFL